MGIDIRDGDQLECINCALCIDACNDVMKRVGLPRGLIAYDSNDNVERRLKGERSRFHFLRPRVVLYAASLAAVGAVMLFALSTRATLDLNVLRERNPTFVRLSDGSIRNAYTVKITNRGNVARTVTLVLTGPAAFKVKVIGTEQSSSPIALEVPADKLRALRVLITVPANAIRAASQPMGFSIGDPKTGETVEISSVFLSQGSNP
jgi:polyferredoxin